MSSPLRLGTRGSRLALRQVELVQATGLQVEPVIIRTAGDSGERERLGAFTSDLEVALLDGHIDAALHCLKDLPTRDVPGLRLAAHLPREDPSDVLISACALEDLPTGAIVGTGALRRTAQLRRLRPDLEYRPLVGNVDTRLTKWSEGQYEAIVLALAGLRRLGALDVYPHQLLTEDVMLPAAGQGVLVLQTRTDGPNLEAWDHAPTRWSARAERAFLSCFGSGCSLPIAARATPGTLKGRVVSPEGTFCLDATLQGEEPTELGQALATHLIEQGALDLLEPRA